jgi:hypothetical protein
MVPDETGMIAAVVDCATYVIVPGTLFATCAFSTLGGTTVPKIVEFEPGDQLSLVGIVAFEPDSMSDGAVDARLALSPE